MATEIKPADKTQRWNGIENRTKEQLYRLANLPLTKKVKQKN